MEQICNNSTREGFYQTILKTKMGVAERNKDICNVWPTCKLKVTPALFLVDLIPEFGKKCTF